MHLKISAAQWRPCYPCYLGLNVLQSGTSHVSYSDTMRLCVILGIPLYANGMRFKNKNRDYMSTAYDKISEYSATIPASYFTSQVLNTYVKKSEYTGWRDVQCIFQTTEVFHINVLGHVVSRSTLFKFVWMWPHDKCMTSRLKYCVRDSTYLNS